MSRYYRYPEPTHWRKLGKLHRPRLCVLCTVERIYKRLGLLSVEPDWWETTEINRCLLYTSPSPRDRTRSRMPSSA